MPFTRPTHLPPQTLAQAKASFRKHGPRISSQEQRQIDRGVELYERAQKIKDAEKRRKETARKKLEREQREREARRRMGIQSRKPYLSQSQCLLEGYVRVVKKEGEGGVDETSCEIMNKILEDQGLDAKMELASSFHGRRGPPEPWMEDDLDDGAFLDVVEDDVPTKSVAQSHCVTDHKREWEDNMLENCDFGDGMLVDVVSKIGDTVGPPVQIPCHTVQELDWEESLQLLADDDFDDDPRIDAVVTNDHENTDRPVCLSRNDMRREKGSKHMAKRDFNDELPLDVFEGLASSKLAVQTEYIVARPTIQEEATDVQLDNGLEDVFLLDTFSDDVGGMSAEQGPQTTVTEEQDTIKPQQDTRVEPSRKTQCASDANTGRVELDRRVRRPLAISIPKQTFHFKMRKETDFITAHQIIRKQDTRIQESRSTVKAHSPPAIDTWDNFLLSNTQIDREISLTPPKTTKTANNLSHDPVSALLSTQDVSLSTDDLEELTLMKPEMEAPMLPQTAKVETTKGRDAFLMPPPPPSSPRESIQAVQSKEVVEKEPFDFGLCTQDFWEILC